MFLSVFNEVLENRRDFSKFNIKHERNFLSKAPTKKYYPNTFFVPKSTSQKILKNALSRHQWIVRLAQNPIFENS